MERKLLKLLAFSTLFLGSEGPVLGLQAVHDSLSFAKVVEVLKAGQAQLKVLQGVRREMGELASVLGDTKVGNVLADKGVNLADLEDMGESLSAIGDGDLWSMNAAHQKYGGGKDASQLIRMKEYAGRKLHGLEAYQNRSSVSDTSDSSPLAPSAVRTQSDLSEVVANRQHYVIEASSTGQAMAHAQKHSWSKEQIKTLKKLRQEGDHQTTLLGMMATNNKLLDLLAAQSQTQNLLLAQILDNVAALAAQTAPIVFRGVSQDNLATTGQGRKKEGGLQRISDQPHIPNGMQRY